MAKIKTTKGASPVKKTVHDGCMEGTYKMQYHSLRLALIESATKVVMSSTDPNCVATAMGFLNHHYTADLPSPTPVMSVDPIAPEAVAPAA